MTNRRSTQFDPEPPLNEEQTIAEMHWLTFAMALRSYEIKSARMDRKAEQAKIRSKWEVSEKRR